MGSALSTATPPTDAPVTEVQAQPNDVPPQYTETSEQIQDTKVVEQVQEIQSSSTPVEPTQTIQPVAVPVPVQSIPTPTFPVSSRRKYIHPFIQLINQNASATEMISTMSAYLSSVEIGTDDNGNKIYDAVDQTEFIAPVIQVFSYCANNGRGAVVQYLMDNFIPLQVSYDNNYCFFETQKWGHHSICDMIVSHQSFVPTMAVLENLYSRSKFEQIKMCMSRAHLTGTLRTYRFTISSYVDQARYTAINDLFTQIKRLDTDATFVITHEVVPDPRFAPKIAVVVPIVEQPIELTPAPVEAVTETVTESVIESTTETIVDDAHDRYVSQVLNECLPEIHSHDHQF